ncbi:MAG: hypothetical protein AB1714_26600 [Acidobacteriota bacterium]
MGRNTVEAFTRTEQDLLREKAAVLARIGGRLARLLRELDEIREQLESVPREGRPPLVAAFNEVREEAERYRWYLMVQREAVGFRRHASLNEEYPIPRPLRR